MNGIPYLNVDEIDFYYEQLYGEYSYVNKSKKTIEISFSGPKYSQTFEKEKENISSLKKLDKILDILSDSKNISMNRPNSVEEYKITQFGYEKIFATKLFFPKSAISEIYGLNHLVVWISNPDCEVLSKKPWDFQGTFLYLIEAAYDREAYRATLSGCSALQVIANIISGKLLFETNWDKNEPFGRGSYKHPIEKLKDIGALEVGEREIETLYRKRYLTNEQCFIHNGEKYRCNDLLAYPLFIAANY